jgi:hypothetical protein
MPRTAITAQSVTSTGPTSSFEAANVLGNSFPYVRGRFIEVINGSGSTITVTVQTPGSLDGNLAIPDRTFTVAAGANAKWAAGDGAIYMQTDRSIFVDYSAVTSVTVGVFDPI